MDSNTRPYSVTRDWLESGTRVASVMVTLRKPYD